MPRVLLACLIALLLTGCSRSNTAATATPARAAFPSAACGGFHLKIVNGLSQTVRVTIGSDWNDLIEAGATETIVGGLTRPVPPPLPWPVEIYDQTGRVTLFRQTMDGAVGQIVALSDGAAAQKPYSVGEAGC